MTQKTLDRWGHFYKEIERLRDLLERAEEKNARLHAEVSSLRALLGKGDK